MIPRLSFRLFLVTAVCATLLSAQQKGAALSLAEALALARASHPALRASQGRLEAAEQKVVVARSGLLPQLRLSGRAAFLSDVPEFNVPFLGPDPLFPSINRSYSARLSLQQNLFSGFRAQNSLEMAERNAGAVRSEARRDESDLALNVTIAYWNLYRAHRAERVLRQTVDQVDAHLSDVRNFRVEGLATDYDVLKVEAQLSEIRVRLIEAQSTIRLTQMTLNSMTGWALSTPVFPSTAPEMSDTSFILMQTIEGIMERARERRPEVSAAYERRNMQEAALGAARGGWYPQILLSAGYDYARPNPRVIPPSDAWEKTWDVGVTIQWNLWDWFATAAQTSQARANLAVADAAFSQVNDAVVLEAAHAYFRAQEARERIEVATLGTKQAEEGFRITQETYKQGMASNSDLLDAEMALLQARLSETQAVVDFAIHVQRLKKATGDLP